MARPHAAIDEIAAGLEWTGSRRSVYKKPSHVNLQELRAVKGELKARAARPLSGKGIRGVNLSDSRVVIGAWAKGRSSSRQVNRILKSCLGYSLAGRVRISNVWVGAKANPADDPTRFVPLRRRKGVTDIVARHYRLACNQGQRKPRTAAYADRGEGEQKSETIAAVCFGTVEGLRGQAPLGEQPGDEAQGGLECVAPVGATAATFEAGTPTQIENSGKSGRGQRRRRRST